MPTREEIELLLIDEEIARRRAVADFGYFCKLAWHIVEPTIDFVGGWHVDAIGLHLEAVLQGEIRNLVINIPPRMSKSTLISVMLPAWVWLRYPGKKFLYSSYAASLSVRDSIKCRRLIESPWYKEFFKPTWTLNDDQNRQDEFSNTAEGHRIATSVGGAGTGKGGDLIICDDPHKATEAYSDTIRQAAIDWWDLEMATRSINPKTVARIIVMQRLHPKDLSGHVIGQGGYELLKLPMEYEGPQEEQPTVIGWQDPRTEIGELLSPGRFGQPEIADLKLRLGSTGYAGQMQQRPVASEGAYVKRSWIKYYDPFNVPWQLNQHTIAADFAASEKTSADFTVMGCAARMGANVYILSWHRERMEFPKALETFKAFCIANPKANKKLIENKSAGQAIIQTLRMTVPGIVEINPTKDKLSRLMAITPFIEAGNLWLPQGMAWVDSFVSELCGFAGEGSGNDDQVDVCAYLMSEFLSAPAAYAPSAISAVGRGQRGY